MAETPKGLDRVKAKEPFNRAANGLSKKVKKPSPKLELSPPAPGGTRGTAQVSPPLRGESNQVKSQREAFKAKLLKQKFNEKARDGVDRSRDRDR